MFVSGRLIHFSEESYQDYLLNDRRWSCVYLCSYIGHVKERTVKEQMSRDSTEVLRKAVHRMLPRNKLRDVSVFFTPGVISVLQTQDLLMQDDLVNLF